MTVAESLAMGVPVITTTGTPWTTLEQKKCGWTVGPDEQNLHSCLQDAMSCATETLSHMGEAGRQWMIEDFSWDEIARRTISVYQWLLGYEGRPDFVEC